MAPAETKAKSPEYEAAVDHAPPSHFAIAYDLNRKGSKTYLGFPTLGKLLEWYDRTRQRSCYEIIRETKPASVAFDLELEFSKPEHAAIAELHGFTRGAPGAFLETAVARITAEFPQLLDGAPPLVSTSHAPGVKHSFHIKYASHFLPTQAHRVAFGEAVGTKLADLVPCIDASVYSRNRPMRLLYSAKGSDSTRSLVPAGSDTTFDIGAVRDHMWSYVPESAVPLDIPIISTPTDAPDGARGVKRQRTTSNTKTASPDFASRFESKFGCTYNSYLARAAALFGGAGTAPTPHDAADESCTYWFTCAPHVCIHGHHHSSDNFQTRITGSVVMRACMAADCCLDSKGHRHLVWLPIGYLDASGAAPCSTPPTKLGVPPGSFDTYASSLASLLGVAALWCIRVYPLSSDHLRARTFLTVDPKGVWRWFCVDSACNVRFHACAPGSKPPPTRTWGVLPCSSMQLQTALDGWFVAEWGAHFERLGITRTARPCGASYSISAVTPCITTCTPWTHIAVLASK